MTIDPEELRARLDQVWAALARDAVADGHEVMRACGRTLLSVVDQSRESDDVLEMLAGLLHANPSRSIVVLLAAGDTEQLAADVDARCWMPSGSRQICSEQIVIRCSERTLAEVPGVVTPLVAADLPVVLWCASERARRSPAFPSLAAPARRIILDTFSAELPLEALETLIEQQRRSPALIADLSWTRLTRWRALLAQVFENRLYRAHIPDFNRITIQYQDQSGRIPPTVLLFAGWVTSRLRWQPQKTQPAAESRKILSFQRPNGPALVTLEHQDSLDSPESLLSFGLGGEAAAAPRISIGRVSEACGEVRIEAAGLDPVMNRVSLPAPTDLMLLGEELAISQRDPAFEESLERAVQIARNLQAG
jgi:glucose-6-phosphate dehydrogenase assembly protein OpcA